MASYRLSRRADRDIEEIYRYSFRQFGEAAADGYLASLIECLELLSENPSLGIDVGWLREGYRRHTHNRHEIFCREEESRLLVVRILGPGMSFERHLR